MISANDLKRKVGAMRFYLILLGLLVLVAYLGLRLGNHLLDSQAHKIAGLELSMQRVTEENNRLTKALNILGVELEVERLANKQLQNSLQQAMQQQAELRKELSFYQKIMAPEMQEQGVVVDSLDIEATNSPGYFRFALVMMQRDARKELVQGEARILIHGSRDGRPATLSLTGQLQNPKDSLGFRFRYFEVLEGVFRLPEDFVPSRLEVECELVKPKKGELKRTFDWLLSVAEGENGE